MWSDDEKHQHLFEEESTIASLGQQIKASKPETDYDNWGLCLFKWIQMQAMISFKIYALCFLHIYCKRWANPLESHWTGSEPPHMLCSTANIYGNYIFDDENLGTTIGSNSHKNANFTALLKNY